MKLHSSQAVAARWIHQSSNRFQREIFVLLAAPVYLSLLAQFSIRLPFTPVPITGQTFGVETIALILGGPRAFFAFVIYLLAGSVGLPVFAQMKSGIPTGPTAGYLIGMALASLVVGFLANRGVTRKFKWAFLSWIPGSICIFGCGVFGLWRFFPGKNPFLTGMLPFLPGDLIKNSLSSFLAVWISQRMDRQES